MNLRNLFRLCAFAAVSVTAAQAQISTTLKIGKKQYIAGEAIVATVTIVNNSGGDIKFQGTPRQPWLDFVVKRGTEACTPTAVSNFGTVTIPMGQSAVRQVNLSSLFNLAEMGNYSVYASVSTPGGINQNYASNRLPFYVVGGRPYWTQKVGIPGSSKVREYRILNYAGDQKTQLFAQVIDDRTGMPIRTFALGDALMFRKPQIVVGRNKNLHAFFLSTPSLWIHSEVDPEGRLVGSALYQRGPSSDPILTTLPDGSVAVANGTYYDPKARAEERAKIRKTSDRPQIGP